MKLNLLENQIELILKALENYETDKKQLLYATYESLLNQKTLFSKEYCNTNVIQKLHKKYLQMKKYNI